MTTLTYQEIIRYNHSVINEKKFLKQFYLERYLSFKSALTKVKCEGKVVELGCGASFIKTVIPETVRTDVFDHDFCDQVVDATKMPFEDGSVKAFFMLNVFHHIPDVKQFLREVSRCLAKGGLLFIVDQHVGVFSYYILKYGHDEFFDHNTQTYSFHSINPLNSANGALAWIIFRRDRQSLNQLCSSLELTSYTPFSPLMYWLLGGLKPWCLVRNQFVYRTVRLIERVLLTINKNTGSFCRIQLEKT